MRQSLKKKFQGPGKRERFKNENFETSFREKNIGHEVPS